MPQPASRRQRQKVATTVAEKNTPSEFSLHPQGCSVSLGAVAAGGGATDDRMDVGQTSTSEADLPDDGSSNHGSVDEETLLHSPFQKMKSEAGMASACSAQAATSGAASRAKHKQDSGTMPHIRSIKMREVHLLVVPLNGLKKTPC